MSKAGRKRKNLPRTPSGQISRSADSKAIAENVRFEEGPEMMAHIDTQAATIKALVEALGEAIATIADYVDYEHDGDPWTEDARAMGEMDIDDYAKDGRLTNARTALAAAKDKPHE